MTPRWGFLLGLLVAVPRVAGACQGQSFFFGTAPEDGGVLPSNAHLLLLGGTSTLFDDVLVTVDGQPAKLIADAEGIVGAAFADIGVPVRIEPAPAVGQTVHVEGNFCGDPSPCEEGLDFTIVEPDGAAPAGVADLEFDLHGFPGLGTTCTDWQDRAWFVRWDTPPTLVGDSAMYHVVEIAAEDSFSELLATGAVLAQPGRTELRVPLYTGESPSAESPVDGPEPQATPAHTFCVRVRTYDVAGHEGSTSAPVCTPRHCRIEPDSFLEQSERWFEEPAWTASDRCAAAEAEQGCGCAATDVPAGSLAALLLLLGRRRRRG
ncbi:hypothetical protein [Nannocystis sp. SCPEA4]|uniref:hypothetical protein n=1 Tax=Nannocystis sp. SCPEA4 TaxID=2996787 RepID=UPI00226F9917|nr:hypothetical protein [Nannocystis sp. SCPEA4]MCY1053811.1 hypothetical protein [Nannocystis sp. SCPEA4]